MTNRKSAVLMPLTVVGLLACLAGFRPGPLAADADPQIGQIFRVPYRLTETNHYLVRVRINGKGPFNFLVDSGAPALFVGTEAAKAVGLEPAEDDYWTPVERLSLEGGIELKDVKARVEDPFQLVGMNALGLPGASIDGILGFTILARFRLEFDPTSDRMQWTRIDFEPREPYVPREARSRKGRSAPAEVRAMEALGPLMKLAAVFVGKQPAEQLEHQGLLGIVFDESKPNELRVAAVLEGSGAKEAGIEVGDCLLQVLGKPVKDLAGVEQAIAGMKTGDEVVLVLERGSEQIERTVRAGGGF